MRTLLRPVVMAGVAFAVLGLGACEASISIGDSSDVERLAPLSSNGEDFTLTWATTDKEGNVVENLLLTTLPGADLDAHYYASAEYGIDRSLATACGFDPATDLLIDGYARSTSSTLVTPVDDHLAFGFDIDGTIAPVAITLVWFDVTETEDGGFTIETICIPMPDADKQVFFFDGYSFLEEDSYAGFNFYLMLTDYASTDRPSGDSAVIDGIAIHPEVESRLAEPYESITGGQLGLDGTYSAG